MDHLLDNDSDEDRDDDLVEQTGKSGYIFLIDARKSMFDGDESYFKKSFQCCYDSMLQLAREQSYDLVSIVLFGTSKSEGKFAPPGIVLYLPLLTTTIDNIRMVKQLIDDGFNQIIGKYGHGKEVVIEKALDYCKKNLYYSPKKLVSKSIILFTNDDNPHKNDEMSAHKARKRAEEIFMHQMELNVVGFGNFDSNIFYKELVLTTRGELLKDWVGRDPIKNVDIIQKDLAIFTRKFKRHFGIFHLGGEAKLPVVFYKLYSEPKRLIWTTKSSEAKNEYNADYKKEVDPLSLCESIYQADTQVDVEEVIPSTSISAVSPEEIPQQENASTSTADKATTDQTGKIAEAPPTTFNKRKAPPQLLPSKVKKTSQDPQASYIHGAIEKLEEISNRAALLLKEDCYDYFGKYVSSMLRNIGPPTAMRLQGQITRLITQAMCPLPSPSWDQPASVQSSAETPSCISDYSDKY